MLRRWIRSPWAWAAWLIVAVLILYPLTAYPRGMLMAYLDHLDGRMEVRAYGYAFDRQNYERYLQEEYGVRVVTVGGCCVSETVVWHADGYNEVSRKLIRDKFGRDIFAECWQRAAKK